MRELLGLSATALAARIRTREVSPSEAVEVHIRRIEEVNPHINAVVANRFTEARGEAKQLDRELLRRPPGALPPFFGVPFTVKELISVEGMPFTAGVVARRGEVGVEDAPLVARLRNAGGIPLGVTNVSEAGLWLESHNRVYGRTNNPHDPRCIAGGSSGGEGAIIAAGGSPMGVGADIGGSIRNPSFFNGICGHKPSGGLLPSVGHWPPAVGRRGRYCVSGPMARRVEDLVTMMEVFSPEEDPHRDPGRPPFRRARGLEPREVPVYYFESNGLTRVDREVADAQRAAVDALARRGFRVERWRPRALFRSVELWTTLVAGSAEDTVRELLGNGAPIPLVREWTRLPFGRARHPFYSLLMATAEGITATSPPRARALEGRRDALRAEIEHKLGERGVLICPPYPRPAPRHHVPLLSPLAFSYCGVFNVLELPATAVPTGMTRKGLPVGVQVVGSRFADPVTLWVAGEIEAALGRSFVPAAVTPAHSRG